MALANSAANIFDLPDPRKEYAERGARGSTKGPSQLDDKDLGLGQAPEGLDYTGQLDQQSQQIMQRWSDLRNFAHSMQSQYGIDVTRPDYRPEAIAANQAFNQERANIQYDIDRMKTSREDYMRRASLAEQNRYAFNSDVGQVPQSTLAPGDAGVSYDVNPTVKFAADQYGRGFRQPSEVRAGEAAALDLQKQFTAQSNAQGDVSAEQASLINPYLEPFAPREGSGADNAQSTFEFLKRGMAVTRGAANYKTSDVYTDPETGQPLSSTKEFNDAFEGIDRKTGKEAKGLITEVLRNFDTGQLYLKLSTQDDLIPVSGTEFIYGISKANPKYPSVDKISKFVGETGSSNDVGEIIPEKFLNQEALNKASQNQQRTSQESSQIAASDAQVKELIGKAYQGNAFMRWFSSNSETPPLSKLGGTRLEFQRDTDNNIVLQNWDDIKTQLKSLGKSNEEILDTKKKITTPEGLFKFIKQYGGSMRKSSIKISDIPNKAAAAGYTPEEYTELLKQKGIQIEE